MTTPEISTDLRPREFGVALLMAATWYFFGPLGIVPTIWFVCLVVKAPPTWLHTGARLLPAAQRRALADGADRAAAQWRQLTAPWREDGAAPPSPREGEGGWGGEGRDDDPLAAPDAAGLAPASSAIPPISLAELARSPNILIVGSPGSGKSTLLHALIAARPWRCYVLDPHSHPAKWPARATPIGGGRNFPAIYAALQRAEAELTRRAQALNLDAGARFARFSLAGDEWGSVASEIVTAKDADPPGRLLLRLLKEGRKFGISFLGAAHGDSAASLGSSGDTEAFRYSFDWLVYMGGFAARELRDQPALVRQLPQGRTAEGRALPLIVVAVSPLTGERRLLDLRGLNQAGATPATARSPQPERRADAEAPAAPAPGPQTASQTDRPPPTPAAPHTRDELIRALVHQGWSVSQIREVVKGDNTAIGALVRQAEDDILHGRS